MTKKQQHLQEFVESVFGLRNVTFGNSWSGSIGVYGHIPMVRRHTGSPLSLPDQNEYTVYMRVWIDRLKDGTYSVKFKTYRNHIKRSRIESALRTVSYIESWKPYILGADVYERSAGYSFEKNIPTLRLHLKSLPWR